MTNAAIIETARRLFADVTAALEDATLIAAEGQAVPDLLAARRSCDRLIKLLKNNLGQLERLRRRLG